MGHLMDEVERGSGVYGITRAGTMVYVGSSICMWKRRTSHLSALRRGRHINRALQASFNRHGEQAFRFVCLERCAADVLVAREQAWLDQLWGDGRQLFNTFRQAYAVRGAHHPMFGRTHTEAARQKIRARRSSQTIAHSTSTRAKIAAGNTGKKLSAETRQRISKGRRGGAAWNKGLTVADPRVAKNKPPRSMVAAERGPVVLERYGAGESIESLRRWLGCSWDVVERFLRESGVTIRTIAEQKRIRDAARRAQVVT